MKVIKHADFAACFIIPTSFTIPFKNASIYIFYLFCKINYKLTLRHYRFGLVVPFVGSVALLVACFISVSKK